MYQWEADSRITPTTVYSFDQSNFPSISNDPRRMPREARAAEYPPNGSRLDAAGACRVFLTHTLISNLEPYPSTARIRLELVSFDAPHRDLRSARVELCKHTSGRTPKTSYKIKFLCV